MRIAIFTETYAPSVNGIVTRLQHTLPALAREGDEVLLFAPGTDSKTDAWTVAGAGGFPLPFYRDLNVAPPRLGIGRRLTRFRPDLIHVVNPSLLGTAGIFHAKRLGLPLVASFHTHLPRYLHHYGLGVFEGLAWDLLRTAHNQADLNLCISDSTSRELVAQGIQNVRVAWRGGVDTVLIHPQRRSDAMRARMGAAGEETPVLLYVGRLGAEKGIERLRPLLDAVPGSRLALVGDGPHRQALEQHFAGTPTHFLGYLRGAELAAAYASADLFCFPSETDTLGLVMLEAMAAGCPVVAARAGGAPDLVADGRTGLLYRGEEPEELIAAARRLLQPGVERELIRAGARVFAESMGWKAAAASLRAAYLELVEAPKRALVA